MTDGTHRHVFNRGRTETETLQHILNVCTDHCQLLGDVDAADCTIDVCGDFLKDRSIACGWFLTLVLGHMPLVHAGAVSRPCSPVHQHPPNVSIHIPQMPPRGPHPAGDYLVVRQHEGLDRFACSQTPSLYRPGHVFSYGIGTPKQPRQPLRLDRGVCRAKQGYCIGEPAQCRRCALNYNKT